MSNCKDPNRPCPDCGRTPLETEFRWSLGKNRDKEYRHSKCQDCENKMAQKKDRDRKLQKKYNMTQAEYNLILKSQNEVCAICHEPKKSQKALAVDHNHFTGVNRQILCEDCNRGLGCFKDDARLLLLAAAYLEKHKCAST